MKANYRNGQAVTLYIILDSIYHIYKLFVRRKEIVLEEMRQLEKQLETINHKLWYYETAIKAGTEDIHKK